MKKVLVAAWMVVGLVACNSNNSEKAVTGIVCDATMNSVTVVGADNDTVFVSTINAKDAGYVGGSFALEDTLTIYYKVVDEVNTATRWEVKPKIKTDPLVGSWIKPIIGMEGEDGFCLNADGTASSINSATLLYKSWKREGDKLLMEVESIGNGVTSISIDTMCIVKLEQDSLIVDNWGTTVRYHKAE